MGCEDHRARFPVVGDVVLLVDRQADNVEGRIDGLDVNDAQGSVAANRHVLDVVIFADLDFPTLELEVKVGEVDLATGHDFSVLDRVGDIHLSVECLNDIKEPQARDANIIVGCVEDSVDTVILDDGW